MTRLGASSPPSVRAVPVKWDWRDGVSSDGGGWALWTQVLAFYKRNKSAEM